MEWPTDEYRIDVIGQNGNDGLHYADANKALRILDDAIARVKWFESTMQTLTKGIPIDLTKEREDLQWLLDQVEKELEENA